MHLSVKPIKYKIFLAERERWSTPCNPRQDCMGRHHLELEPRASAQSARVARRLLPAPHNNIQNGLTRPALMTSSFQAINQISLLSLSIDNQDMFDVVLLFFTYFIQIKIYVNGTKVFLK